MAAESLQDVKDALRARKVSLWPGASFDLTDEVELREAALWLIEEINHLGLSLVPSESASLEERVARLERNEAIREQALRRSRYR